MKLVIGAALAVLIAGASGYAQEPDRDKPKEETKKQEEPKKGEQPHNRKQEEPRPAEKQKQEPDRRPGDHARPAQQSDHPQQQQEERNRSQQKAEQDRAQDQQRARQTGQHSDRDAGGRETHGNARRIPEEKFRVSFGREHRFHVERRDDRRFSYGGYWFVYNEPWPGDWDYNDDVYVDYIDGEYYLINPRRPGVRLLIIVSD